MLCYRDLAVAVRVRVCDRIIRAVRKQARERWPRGGSAKPALIQDRLIHAFRDPFGIVLDGAGHADDLSRVQEPRGWRISDDRCVTRPTPSSRRATESRPYRVEREIASEFGEMGIVLDDLRPEPPLIDVTGSRVPLVEV